MTIRGLGILLLAAVALAAPPPAQAQIQNTAQRGCIISVNKAGAKLVKTIRKTVSQCGRTLDAGGNDDVLACVTADISGKIGSAKQKVSSADQLKCVVEPSFGYAGATMVNSSACSANSSRAASSRTIPAAAARSSAITPASAIRCSASSTAA